MSYPKYNLIAKTAVSGGTVTVTNYTTKSAAQTAYDGFVAGGLYSDVALYLESLPSKSFAASTRSGTYTDAYGVVRNVADGTEYTP